MRQLVLQYISVIGHTLQLCSPTFAYEPVRQPTSEPLTRDWEEPWNSIEHPSLQHIMSLNQYQSLTSDIGNLQHTAPSLQHVAMTRPLASSITYCPPSVCLQSTAYVGLTNFFCHIRNILLPKAQKNTEIYPTKNVRKLAIAWHKIPSCTFVCQHNNGAILKRCCHY